MLSFAFVAHLALILFLFYVQSVKTITIHSTCKSMTGVDEYGYGPDVSDAISNAYETMRTISANAANVLENYQKKKLPPNESARIASLLTAFGLSPGDRRESMFILLATCMGSGMKMQHAIQANSSLQRHGDCFRANSSLKMSPSFVGRHKALTSGNTSPKHLLAKIGRGEVCIASSRCFRST